MLTEPFEFDESLLDLHLGRLSEADRAAALKRISENPNVARQNDALNAVFAALGSIRRDIPTPAGLHEKVSARVAAAGRPPRVIMPGKAPPDEYRWVLRVSNVRDIVAAAAVIVLMVGLGVPAMLQVRERNQRLVCSANLARLGQGIASYASAFGDSLPFAGWGNRTSWQPSSDPGIETLPNRRHVYRLLPGRNAQTAWFVCPSARDVPMPQEQVAHQNDFLSANNVSYAYQNQAGKRVTAAQQPDLPVLADDNPLFDDGRPLFDIKVSLGFRQLAETNSRAHGGSGQNILTAGGRVKWVTTPNSGVNGENIWTLEGVENYTGREGPQSATDAHLLK